MSAVSSAKVTIAIPTRNRLNYLQQALESALGQSYENLEVVVSDNCSEDRTSEYLKRVKNGNLTVIQQSTNIGMIANWDACLERATGEYFLLLSDDDLLERDAIRSLVAAIENAEQPAAVAFAYCRCWVIDQKGSPISLDPIAPPYESSRDFVLGFFSKKREIRPCTTLIRTADVRALGGYRQGDVVLAVDAIVWSRTLRKRQMAASVQQPLASYRIHTLNLSSVQSIGIWQQDLRALSQFWLQEFKSEPLGFRKQLISATRGHHAWMISVTINQSARSYPDRLRLLRTYVHCHRSFEGIAGWANLGLGLLKLLVPELVKKRIRDFLIRKQRGSKMYQAARTS